MFFKTLEIQGFKSFADKTILSFDTKTTAIVGSNGNGKSNISDALRWVMGEQGAKTLRGDKMEDVIFHGTVSRKQMGFAKVALSIDNTDRTLGVDSDEVVIMRKLYRTGESEYLINGAKSRLKDIQELLMGTGLGRDGYSIIGQGRVAEIINSKGAQRREIFEEAAGVSKFIHRKAEAERDLARAEENILRLKDIAHELEERIPTLEKQSEKAQKARVLLENEKQLEISVSVSELERIEHDMWDIENSILQNQGECEHFEREIGELEKESETIAESKLKLAAEREQLSRLGEEKQNEIAEADKSVAVMENEISHHEARINTIAEQIKNSETGEKEFDEKLGKIEKGLSEKLSEIEETDRGIAEKKALIESASGENSRLGSEYGELDRALASLYAKKSEASLSKIAAEDKLNDLNEQLTGATEGIDNREAMLKEYREKRKALKIELQKLTEEREETENKLGGYSKLYEGKKQKLDASRTEVDNLRRDYDRTKSRLDVLSDVERNMAGYFGSVKAIIVASKSGKLSDIHGTVADIIKVDKKYGVAIEIALGNALQNIIVGSEETAKRCIRYLKESNGGRATFLPLTSIRGTLLNYPALEGEQGFLGIGSELVSFDEKYTDIVRSVLGKTAIVDDIDTATFIAKKYGYKFRIITLDGQIVNAGGSFTGGSVKESAGIISRKQELESLEGSIKKLSDTLEFAKASFSTLNAETGKMAIEIEGFKEQLAAAKGDEMRLTAEIGGVSDLIKQCEEQQDSAETVIDRHKQAIAAQTAVIEKCAALLADCEKEIAAKDSLVKEADSALKAAAESLKAMTDELSSLTLSRLAAEKDAENLKNEAENVRANKANIGKNNDVLRAEADSLREKIEEIRREIAEKKESIETIRGSFTDNRAEISAIVEKTNALEQRMVSLTKEIREKSDDKEKFSNALSGFREKKAGAERESEKLKSALWDKYELAPSEAKKLAVELPDMPKAKNELAEIRRKISSLGSVNYAAIEEFAEVSERYSALSTQLSDVEKSKKDLENLIAGLITDIKAKFLSSFNEINEHFGAIFREVFGGGQAHLELTDPEDILGSGIEIFAAPPGKLIKNLISLSGGEQTMVAITIYFAILLHRPTPFCMLDEVDAALDEVNVVKYITYLKRFSNHTQLMVISHRRGTIEGCDVLYGVFMQEKGVSRLLRQEIIDDLDVELN